MKTIIISLLATLALSACGGGDDDPVNNTSAEFNSGDGVDSGEIHAESSEALTGKLTVSDIDDGQAGLMAQTNVQGKFGAFSINAAGDWSYSITNFADDFVSPEEMFTVASIDGTEHQITIMVKGLFQRQILSDEYTLSLALFDEYHNYISPDEYQYYDYLYDESVTIVHSKDFPILTKLSSLYDAEWVQSAISSFETPSLEIYDEQGVRTSTSTFLEGYSPTEPYDTTTYRYDEHGNFTEKLYFYRNFNDTEPESTYTYQNEYTDGELTSILEENKQYLLDGNNDVYLSKLKYRQFGNSFERSEYQSYEQYNYDSNDLSAEPLQTFLIDYSYNFNESGKVSEYYTSYLDTDFRDIDSELEGPRLREQYYYNANGDLDYELSYRTSISYLSEGAKWKYKYVYDEYNRLSLRLYYGAVSSETNEEGVLVYDELALEPSSITLYIYNDELEVELSVYIRTQDYALTSEVDGISITQYEDIDYCDGTPAKNCRPKVQSSSSLTLPALP